MLESICRLAYANPTNLSSLIHLCLASELPTTSAMLKANEAAVKQQQQAHQPQTPSASSATSAIQSAACLSAARSISEVVKLLLGSNGGDLATANAALVASGASEAVAKGYSSVPFILPKLYQRFNSQWVKVCPSSHSLNDW